MYSSTQAYTPGEKLDTTRSLLIGMKEKGTLQSYVAQHRNSPEYPYLLALATSINQISNATKAAQHQPAPQTVADQKLGSLAPAPAPAPQLPEDAGIAQLPAQNIEGMAAGGIVAFDEGGEVPRFQDKGLVYGNYGFGNTAAQPQYTQAQLAEAQRLREMGLIDLLKEKFGPAWQALTTPPAAKVKQETFQSGTDIGGPGSSPANMGAAVTTTTPAPTINFDNQQGAGGAGAGGTGGAGMGGAGGTKQPAAGLSSLDAYLKRFEMGLPKKEEVQSEESFMRKREEPMREYFSKANQAIQKERSRLEEGKQQDFYMSLIEGGLAAAGGTSQYGLQNLAQGFSKGASSFRDALKDYRKAAQENSRMEMDLMKAKAADKKGDMDAYQKHMNDVADRNAKVDGYKASGNASIIGHKMSADATITAAGMPSGTERLIGRIGTDPKFAAAYEKYAAMGPNAKLPNQILAKYADPKELMKLKVMDPDLYAQVKAQLDMVAGFGGVPMPQVMNQPSGNARP